MEEGASLKNLWELIKKLCLFRIPPKWFYWLLLPLFFVISVKINIAMKDLQMGNPASESAFVWQVTKSKAIILIWFIYMLVCSIVNRFRHIISKEDCISHIILSLVIALFFLFFPIIV